MNGGGFIGEGRDVCVVFMFFAVFLLAPCLKVAVTILEVWVRVRLSSEEGCCIL